MFVTYMNFFQALEMITHLTAVTLGVAEGEWTSEGALDQFSLLPEHGVEWSITRDGVAEPLHRLNVLLAVA